MLVWLLVGYLLLVPSFSQDKGCTGPERNAIQAVLKDVNWENLADQLNLQDQVADIQDKCINKRPCYFREVVSRYIQSQPEESCDNTRRKIVKALEELGYVKEASQLGVEPSHWDQQNQAGKLIVENQISSESSTVEPIKQLSSPAILIFVSVLIVVITVCTYMYLKDYKLSPVQQKQLNKRQDQIEQASQQKEMERQPFGAPEYKVHEFESSSVIQKARPQETSGPAQLQGKNVTDHYSLQHKTLGKVKWFTRKRLNQLMFLVGVTAAVVVISIFLTTKAEVPLLNGYLPGIKIVIALIIILITAKGEITKKAQTRKVAIIVVAAATAVIVGGGGGIGTAALVIITVTVALATVTAAGMTARGGIPRAEINAEVVAKITEVDVLGTAVATAAAAAATTIIKTTATTLFEVTVVNLVVAGAVAVVAAVAVEVADVLVVAAAGGAVNIAGADLMEAKAVTTAAAAVTRVALIVTAGAGAAELAAETFILIETFILTAHLVLPTAVVACAPTEMVTKAIGLTGASAKAITAKTLIAMLAVAVRTIVASIVAIILPHNTI